MSRWTSTKEQVLTAALELYRMGLNSGLSGNISVKIDGEQELIAITPSRITLCNFVNRGHPRYR